MKQKSRIVRMNDDGITTGLLDNDSESYLHDVILTSNFCIHLHAFCFNSIIQQTNIHTEGASAEGINLQVVHHHLEGKLLSFIKRVDTSKSSNGRIH